MPVGEPGEPIQMSRMVGVCKGMSELTYTRLSTKAGVSSVLLTTAKPCGALKLRALPVVKKSITHIVTW